MHSTWLISICWWRFILEYITLIAKPTLSFSSPSLTILFNKLTFISPYYDLTMLPIQQDIGCLVRSALCLMSNRTYSVALGGWDSFVALLKSELWPLKLVAAFFFPAGVFINEAVAIRGGPRLHKSTIMSEDWMYGECGEQGSKSCLLPGNLQHEYVRGKQNATRLKQKYFTGIFLWI